jgi:hypothetical protein
MRTGRLMKRGGKMDIFSPRLLSRVDPQLSPIHPPNEVDKKDSFLLFIQLKKDLIPTVPIPYYYYYCFLYTLRLL